MARMRTAVCSLGQNVALERIVVLGADRLPRYRATRNRDERVARRTSLPAAARYVWLAMRG